MFEFESYTRIFLPFGLLCCLIGIEKSFREVRLKRSSIRCRSTDRTIIGLYLANATAHSESIAFVAFRTAREGWKNRKLSSRFRPSF